MTPLYHARKSDGRWFVRAFALLMFGVPAVAQQANVSAPLNADEVMQRVVAMNEVRAKALESYSSVRSYRLECHCLSHKQADMTVRVEYRAPDKKTFTIVSESGSGSVRSKVFKKLLEAEQESMREENQQSSAISPENYTFELVDYEKSRRKRILRAGRRAESEEQVSFSRQDLGRRHRVRHHSGRGATGSQSFVVDPEDRFQTQLPESR